MMSAPSSAPQGPPIPGASPKHLLGAGGFADVFLYEQQVPRRDVAVKILRQGGSRRDHHRFTTEADLMARLSSHPSIVSVYGAGTLEEDRSYLIMEYCPPPHLGKLAASQPLPLTRALEIGIRLAGAVETIHRVGYLHRDIKPASILLTPFGRPVLGDFGIAAPIGLSAEQDEFRGASPPWASPEQQLNQEILTPASDVYALAATIYTLLAGRSPHVDVSGADRNDQLSMLDRVLHQQIPRSGDATYPSSSSGSWSQRWPSPPANGMPARSPWLGRCNRYRPTCAWPSPSSMSWRRRPEDTRAGAGTRTPRCCGRPSQWTPTGRPEPCPPPTGMTTPPRPSHLSCRGPARRLRLATRPPRSPAPGR